MEELVYLKNGEPTTDSLKVAKYFGKRHDKVLRSIENITNNSPQKWVECFKQITYRDESGKANKMYSMNEKAYSVLVMGFTGKKALEWKWKYAEAFEQMKNFISEKQTVEWKEMRKAGKITRRAETDVIKELIVLAKKQGSTHADMLYMTYSKLANKMAGISKREAATFTQLNNLSLFEQIILNIIHRGISEGKNYKLIYQDCKARCETTKQMAFIG